MFTEWKRTEKDEDIYRGVRYAPNGRCEVNDKTRKVNVSFGAVDMYPDDLVERIKAELVAEFHPTVLATSPRLQAPPGTSSRFILSTRSSSRRRGLPQALWRASERT